MGIRTGKQYVEGLRDDRRIYINVDDSQDPLRELRRLLDLNLRLLRPVPAR